MNTNIEFQKLKQWINHTPVWMYSGVTKIDNYLTLFYRVYKLGDFYNAEVSDHPNYVGTYWEVEQLHDTIEQAQNEIIRFINKVNENPSEYFDKDEN